MNVPHGEGKDHQWVLPGLSKVESVETGMLLSGAEKKLMLRPMISFIVRL